MAGETKVVIDVSKIPADVQTRLAMGTLAAVRRFLAHPGGKEVLETKIAEMKLKERS